MLSTSTYRSGWHTQELAQFRDLARTFLAKEVAPHHERWAKQQQVDRELWRQAGEIGLLCLAVPEEYGGGGGSFFCVFTASKNCFCTVSVTTSWRTWKP